MWRTSSSWLTAARLRAHGLILALCLWSVYFWYVNSPGLLDRGGNLKGTDFLHFYTLGSLALAHRGADLYNAEVQSCFVTGIVPAATGIRYLPLYPPQVSIFFAPFARLPYPRALILWLVLSALIYGLCCYAIWRVCPNLHQHKLTILVLALAFPAFWHLIAWGQTSALALACFTLAFLALRAQREFLAGLALGCLIFKPQLAIASAILFLIMLRWTVIVGAFVSAAAQVAAAWLYYGPSPLIDWIRALVAVQHHAAEFEPRLYQTHCLRTFWLMMVPWPKASNALYLVSAILFLALTVAFWRSRLPLSPRYSGLLLATVLISPHLTVYDLVILAPAFLLLSDWLIAKPCAPTKFKLLLYLLFALPLLGPLARWSHVQLSVLVMTTLLYGIWKVGRNFNPNFAF
jgi:alpha-1,2-mannosyltransferase